MVSLGSGLGPILSSFLSFFFKMCLYFAYLIIAILVVGVMTVLFHVES